MAPSSARVVRLPTTLVLLLTALLPVAACGGDEGAGSAEAGPPMRDTTAPPIERQPLGEDDRVGAEPFNLVMELPWTGNQASRDPAPAAAQASLLDAEVLGTEGFDRVVMAFSDRTAFPGYQIRLVDEGAVTCASAGDEPRTVTLDGERALVVRVHPARNELEGETTVPSGVTDLGHTRLQEGGLVCTEGRELVWAASVAEGAEIRVLELREPNRLVVDLR